jgi:hypothetical protein
MRALKVDRPRYVIARSEATKQSMVVRKTGLLRCARNDAADGYDKLAVRAALRGDGHD